MSVQKQYLQASFRGVNFLITSENEEGGKKTVTHEYPNSNRRFVEELGTLPSNFSMSAFVHGPTAVQSSRELIRVLGLPGVGVLVHPIYGRLEVKSTKWSRSTQETEMGEIKFSLEFSRSDTNISLSPSVNTLSAVSASAGLARRAAFNAVATKTLLQKTKYALGQTQKYLNLALRAVRLGAKGLPGNELGALAIFDKVFKTSLADIYKVGLSGANIANTLEKIYDAVRGVSPPSTQREYWRGLATYDKNRPQGKLTTRDRIAAENNANVLGSHTRTNALINLYESVAASTYNTDQELQEARAELEQLFIDTLGDNSNNPLADDNDLRQAVLDLRNVTNLTLDGLASNVFNIETVTPGETSLTLLCYQFYGNLDNLETLRQLNLNVNHAEIVIGDQIKVIS